MKNDWKSWALALFVSLSGTFGMWAWSASTQRLSNLERLAEVRGERMVRVEQDTSNLKESLIRIEKKLDDLTEKMDRRRDR